MGFAEIIKGRDHRASLEALLDKLAEEMEKADPNVVPQFAARIQAVLADLKALPSTDKSEVDELIERRKARRAGSDSKLRAKQRRGSKPGA